MCSFILSLFAFQKNSFLNTGGTPLAIETMERAPTLFNNVSPHQAPHDKNRSDRQARS